MNLLDPTTRPYLVRALYEWASDQGLTPHLVVMADDSVEVPRAYVRDGQIVLNIGAAAVEALSLTNEMVHFRARFGGVAQEVMVPMNRVVAIYARENGEGMAFPMQGLEELIEDGDEDAAPAGGERIRLVTDEDSDAADDPPPDPHKPGPGGGKRPGLRRVK